MKNENQNKKSNQKIIIIFLLAAIGVFLLLFSVYGKGDDKDAASDDSMSAED